MTTTASITAPLISLAMLKVHWHTRHKDYVDNFVPMVAECIRTSEHDVVSIPALQQEVRTAFGLRLPLGGHPKPAIHGHLKTGHHA